MSAFFLDYCKALFLSYVHGIQYDSSSLLLLFVSSLCCMSQVLECTPISHSVCEKETSASTNFNSDIPPACPLHSPEARAVIEKAAADANKMKMVFGAAAHLPLSWQAGDATSAETSLSPAARAGEVVSSVGLEVAELMLAWTAAIVHS